jgi:hypothetical protein
MFGRSAVASVDPAGFCEDTAVPRVGFGTVEPVRIHIDRTDKRPRTGHRRRGERSGRARRAAAALR